MSKSIDRTGEETVNQYGTVACIIRYNDTRDLDVQF